MRITGDGNVEIPKLAGRSYHLPSVSSDNPNIVIGTNFNSIPIQVGDEITFYNNQVRTVTSVTNTQLTVDQSWDVSFANTSANGKAGIGFNTKDTERMRITADGNVGIGTNSPDAILHLKDITPTSDNVCLRMENDAQIWELCNRGFDDDRFTIYDVTANSVPFKIEKSSPTNSFYIKSDGKVGIGTSAPSGKLDVNTGVMSGNVKIGNFDNVNNGTSSNTHLTQGTKLEFIADTNPRYSNHNTNTVAFVKAEYDGSDSTADVRTGNTALTFATHSGFADTGTLSEKMRISSFGNVGIGTTNPHAFLHVHNIHNNLFGSNYSAVFGGDSSPLIPYSGFDSQYGINAVEIQGADSGSYGFPHLFLRSRLSNYYGGGITFISDDTDKTDKRFASISADRVSRTDENNNTYFDSGNLKFYTRGETDDSHEIRMTIDSDGNVGIGVGSPQTQLQVHNPNNAASYSKFTNVNTGATSTDGTTVGISTAGDFQIWNWENSEVQIATNNTQRLTIDSSGNIEVSTGNLVIGTAGKGIDSSLWTYNGTSKWSNTSGVTRTLRFGEYSSTNDSGFFGPDTDTNSDGKIDLGTSDGRFRDGYFSGTVSSGVLKEGGTSLINKYLSSVAVNTGTGIVGGATLTPSSTSVNISLDFAELADMTTDISGTTEFILLNGNTESRKAASEIKLSNFNIDIETSKWTDSTSVTGAIYRSSGKVGIRESSPSAMLDINSDITGGTNEDLRIINTANTEQWHRGILVLHPNVSNTNAGTIMFGNAETTGNSGHISFKNSAVDGEEKVSIGIFNKNDLLNIQGNGNVGIGTISPDTKLHIHSNTSIGNETLLKLQRPNGYGESGFNQYYNSAAGSDPVLWGLNFGLGVSSDTDGKVGIKFESTSGTTTTSDKIIFRTANTNQVDIDNSGNLTATGTITSTSDISLKENIELISDPIEKVKELSGYTFNKKGEDLRMVGLIAQEVEKVLPEAVHENQEGIKSLAYGNMVALLVECIKKQDERIETLEKTIEKLKL